MADNLLDRVDAALDSSRSLDRYLRRVHTDDHTEPHSDRQSTGHMKALDMGQGCRIVYGNVVDTVAYCHWYKVQPEGGSTTLPCCMLAGTALTPFGVREHNQLHPNAGVYVLLHPRSPYGVIIGVEPKHQSDGTKSLSDYISYCSAHTLQTEQVHNHPFTLPKNGTVVDWSAGRPVDGTGAGEWGMFAETGVAVFLDSAMAFLKADENTGVWAFYRDQVLRVAGHNVQVRASGGWEVEALDDQGEFNYVEGWTPYPWEQLGAFERATDPATENDAQATQVSQPHYSKYEPKADDQQPFHRTRHYHGYAGQGGKRVVTAPPKAPPEVNRYGEDLKYVGLFEEHITSAGLWTVRTAKGVRIVKRSLIPVAKPRRRPEAADGDNETNYRAASAQGGGREHRVRGEVRAGGQDPHMQRALGLMDEDAYRFNWEAFVGFQYHEKDYYLPEEGDLAADVCKGIEKIQFGQLAGQNFLREATPGQARVDHRYGEVKVYPSYSYFEMLDDGGVVLGDGYGTEIRMVGGNLYLTAPGDVFLQPGRRLVGMAGTDVVLRAKNSVDVTATDRDVRILAKKNVEVGADKGGVLIESKAEQLGWGGWKDRVGEDVQQYGVHLKAANSGVCAWGDLIYLRTGVDGPGTGFYIDAGQGEGHLAVNANSVQTWARSAVADYLGGGPSVRSAYVYSPGGAVLGGYLCVDGSVVSTGTVLADGWFLSAAGHVATAESETYKGLVPALKDEGLARAQENVADCKTGHADARNQAGDQYTQTWDDGLYPENMCGNDDTIKDVTQSFRTTAQYRARDFRLYEARWQQLGRIWGTASTTWGERALAKSGEDTYPFPGKEKLVDDPCFYTQDLKLFDLEAGHATDRKGGDYEDPQFEAPAAKTLNAEYLVTG